MEYTIKEVSQKYSLSPATLRYYEAEKLLPKIAKNSSNQRVYQEEDLQWLDIIMCMRKTGMSISYIRNYIELCHEGDTTVRERFEIILKQKEILTEQMNELKKNMDMVNHKVEIYKNKLR